MLNYLSTLLLSLQSVGLFEAKLLYQIAYKDLDIFIYLKLRLMILLLLKKFLNAEKLGNRNKLI